ncbi:unnamed protein product [Rhodiola kirilowii]
MDDEGAQGQPPILFGRPFLKTARAKIDVDCGTLSMEVEGEVINFNIYQAMQCPPDDVGVYTLDAIDELVESSDIPYGDDVLEIILREAFQLKEAAPVDLTLVEKGIPTFPRKVNGSSKDKEKEKKHRNHKEKDREKDREHKKHKHRHKDLSKDKDRDRDKKRRAMIQTRTTTRKASMMEMKILTIFTS